MEIAQEKLTLHAEMHRKAGKLGFSGIPKLSNIDKRWFMEVDQIATAHGRYTHTVPNIAFGTGDTPLEAAADGYAKAAPEMALYPILAKLETVVPQVRRHIAAEKKLVEALTDLTDTVRSLNVPRIDEDEDL